MRLRWPRRRQRHECAPPHGVVYAPTWLCPVCRTRWRLVQHATWSEWIIDEATA